MGQNTLGGGGTGLLSTGGGLGMGQTQLGTGKHILVLCIWCKVGYLVLFSDPIWIVVGFVCIMLAMTWNTGVGMRLHLTGLIPDPSHQL